MVEFDLISLDIKKPFFSIRCVVKPQMDIYIEGHKTHESS